MSDDPPILPVGTAVSAKYKGAFCEAKVSRVFPQLRYRVSFKEPHTGTETLKEEHIKATGPIRTGRTVLAWHPTQKTFLEAQVTKIQDQSQYTVVFDDGDITTLRRNYLCLKSGRHFNESETLDQLPLTHPEHFSNPVIGGRSRRRNRNREDDSEGEHEQADPEMEGYHSDVGRVVWGENLEKKRNKDWPPGLIMMPKNTKILNTKEEFLIRSFKDDRFYNVPKKDVIEFSKEVGEKLENNNSPFSVGVQKALKYLNTGELPANWEKHFHSDRMETDAELNFSDSSDDEPCEEKDRFVAQLFKFLDEAGTPLNKTPTIAGEDVDLYRLFSVVNKLGGYNKVNNHNKWKAVTGKLKYGNSQSITNQVKAVYKKCLLSFETFYKTLGVTMLTFSKSSRKNKGRSLIRDKDRATPINSPKTEKEEETTERKEEEKPPEDKKARPSEIKDDDKTKKDIPDASESSSDNIDPMEPSTSRDLGRPKRYTKVKSWAKEKKSTKVSAAEKSKPIGEKPEEPSKKDDEKDKGQQTRSKTQLPKALTPTLEKKVESKTPTKEIKEKDNKDIKDKNLVKTLKRVEDEKDKTKRPRKRSNIETENVTDVPASFNINKGDKLKVYYGPSIESKVTYEAKVLDIVRDGPEPFIRVHYTGWNNRYDEWIKMERVAENLSATTKAKKIKQIVSGTSSPVASKSPSLTSNKQIKRKRGASDSRRPSINETPRSTTPLSSTSTSSRPKTPATPATRSTTRSITQEQKRIRRTSVQTDTSVHTDTESPASESEAEELSRTRSGGKSDETEVKVYKKKIQRTTILHKMRPKTREEDDDTEKEEDQIVKERIVKRTRKVKRTPEKSNDESDDEGGSLPKGRDFDLNQIRSELKGFSKALPLNSIDSADKDSSSDDSAKPLDIDVHVTAEEEEEEKELKKIEEKDMKPLEETSSCEDIYEFKEPEPFEFESRSSLGEDKSKKRLNRFYEDLEKSPSKGTSKVQRLESSYETDKKTFRSPVKIIDFDEDGGIDSKPKKESGDLFDKLVESPSFNIVKTAEKQVEAIPKLEVEESIEILGEPPEVADDCSGDMELSDTESQTQPIFTVQSEEVFSDAFTKSSSEQNTLDLEFCKSEDRNVDEEIQASIQRVIEQTSTDDDTQDALLQVTLPVTTYQVIKHEQAKSPLISPKVMNVIEETVSTEKNIEIVEKSAFGIIKQLTPVVHSIVKESPNTTEIVSNLVVSTSPIPIQVDDDLELKAAEISLSQNLEDSKDIEMIIVENEVKDEIKIEKIDSDKIEVVDIHQDITESCSIEPDHLIVIENDQETIEIKVDTEESETADDSQNLIVVSPKEEVIQESKKRRKVISRPFIESDTDSTDSDNLIIARSDDESQSNSTLDKEMKDNWDSNMSTTEVPTNMTDDSQAEDQRNFKFEESTETENKQEKQNEEAETKSISDHVDIEDEQKEENDSQLHSMLLCEETIPRSPAPPTETNVEEPVRRSKSALEMPFASVPGSSNNKSMLLNPNPAKLHQQTTLIMQMETENEGNASPLSSAESTLSNLSPRGNNGGLSPFSQNNDNSNTRTEFQEKRTNSNKMSAYSDEDSQLVCESSSSQKKNIKDDRPSTSTGRKSRRSYQSNEQPAPAKKGRKSSNRSGHNSDSEENAPVNSPKGKDEHNSGKWPERPAKYDFRVNLDGVTDRNERINLVLNSMTSLRKTYADLKAELADLDRRRKKIKRRKREGRERKRKERRDKRDSTPL